MVDPQPIQYNRDGSIKFPTSTASSSPTVAPSLDGATIRAVGDQSANSAEFRAGLGLTGSGGGATSDSTDPSLLWQRRTPTKRSGSVNAAENNTPQVSDVMKLSDAEVKIFSNDNYRAGIAKQMVAAGLLDPTQINDLGAIQKAWKQVVGQAAGFYQAGNPRTPEEVIALINVQKKAAAAPVPTTTTDNTTQVQNFATTAPGDIRTALQNMLGRAPTPHEMQSYQAGLHAAAQANPQQQQTVTHDDGSGNTTRNVTQSGGIDPTEVIGQMAQADPEYGAYQASTTYMAALKDAIGAFV